MNHSNRKRRPNCILSSSDNEDDHATELSNQTIRDDQISEQPDTFEIENEIANDRLLAQRLFEEFNPNMTIADLSSTNAVTNLQSSGKYISKSKYNCISFTRLFIICLHFISFIFI